MHNCTFHSDRFNAAAAEVCLRLVSIHLRVLHYHYCYRTATAAAHVIHHLIRTGVTG